MKKQKSETIVPDALIATSGQEVQKAPKTTAELIDIGNAGFYA